MTFCIFVYLVINLFLILGLRFNCSTGVPGLFANHHHNLFSLQRRKKAKKWEDD